MTEPEEPTRYLFLLGITMQYNPDERKVVGPFPTCHVDVETARSGVCQVPVPVTSFVGTVDDFVAYVRTELKDVAVNLEPFRLAACPAPEAKA